jgi:hypothetical protein
MVDISAEACSSVTPGLSRPSTFIQWLPRAVSSPGEPLSSSTIAIGTYLISRGYSPVGSWEVEADSDDGSGGKDAVETSRTFKLTVFEFESAPVPAPGGPVNER